MQNHRKLVKKYQKMVILYIQERIKCGLNILLAIQLTEKWVKRKASHKIQVGSKLKKSKSSRIIQNSNRLC